ncbi:DUF5999 family protein [Streptomyces sp. NPDC055078]
MTTPARCGHQPLCPDSSSADRDAARLSTHHAEQVWSLLCNVVLFEVTGDLLSDGQMVAPRGMSVARGGGGVNGSSGGSFWWPPRSSDPASLLHAYTEVLGWPLVVAGAVVDAEGALRLLRSDPDVTVGSVCGVFDAATVPVEEGRKAMVLLDRAADHRPGLVSVPSLRGHGDMTFVLESGTAAALDGLPGVRISREREGLVLPPTRGWVWDTPPWKPRRREAAGPPDADMLREALARALHTRGGHAP